MFSSIGLTDYWQSFTKEHEQEGEGEEGKNMKKTESFVQTINVVSGPSSYSSSLMEPTTCHPCIRSFGPHHTVWKLNISGKEFLKYIKHAKDPLFESPLIAVDESFAIQIRVAPWNIMTGDRSVTILFRWVRIPLFKGGDRVNTTVHVVIPGFHTYAYVNAHTIAEDIPFDNFIDGWARAPMWKNPDTEPTTHPDGGIHIQIYARAEVLYGQPKENQPILMPARQQQQQQPWETVLCMPQDVALQLRNGQTLLTHSKIMTDVPTDLFKTSHPWSVCAFVYFIYTQNATRAIYPILLNHHHQGAERWDILRDLFTLSTTKTTYLPLARETMKELVHNLSISVIRDARELAQFTNPSSSSSSLFTEFQNGIIHYIQDHTREYVVSCCTS